MKVSKKEMLSLGFLGKTTDCSYEDDEFVYLEEDCDLTTFVKLKEKNGESVDWKDNTVLEYSTERFFNVAGIRPITVDSGNIACEFCGRCGER